MGFKAPTKTRPSRTLVVRFPGRKDWWAGDLSLSLESRLDWRLSIGMDAFRLPSCLDGFRPIGYPTPLLPIDSREVRSVFRAERQKSKKKTGQNQGKEKDDPMEGKRDEPELVKGTRKRERRGCRLDPLVLIDHYSSTWWPAMLLATIRVVRVPSVRLLLWTTSSRDERVDGLDHHRVPLSNNKKIPPKKEKAKKGKGVLPS